MILFSTITLFLTIAIMSTTTGLVLSSDPLFLTPLINSGKIDEARKLSKVENLSETVTSYSGFITVDEENGVNTFFWFFPAFENFENAPVFLWSEGGPGVSGLMSAFNEQGPFLVTAAGNLELREHTWAKNHSIIYMDQPMDVGFSFTEKEEGYVTSGIDAAPNIYKFLIQFFKLFPELQDNAFYNSGVSFGGIYAPAAAHYIHAQNNAKNPAPEFKINLKGLLLETPFSDAISQVDYGEYLYYAGLIDDNAREKFKVKSAVIKDLIVQEKYLEAQELNLELLWGHQFGTYFTNTTGFASNFNILNEKPDPAITYFLSLVENESFRNSLHVGNLTFTFASPLVQNMFKPTILKTVKHLIEDLLDLDYKILIYGGNLDIITSHIGVSAMIRSFQWSGAQDYAQSTNQIWRVDGDIAGYARTAKNFTYVLVRNSGHGATLDQPKWTFDLVNRFATGASFSK
jgi:vitellogenic carboxypeptidase-like protein